MIPLLNLYPLKDAEFLKMEHLQPLHKQVLVEKHLISPNLAEQSPQGACLLSQDEVISIMVNEEDHIRIQCIFSGLQLEERSEEHTSELQSRENIVCRLLLEKK